MLHHQDFFFKHTEMHYSDISVTDKNVLWKSFLLLGKKEKADAVSAVWTCLPGRQKTDISDT